ncbi:hypothetical protein [Methanobrevibacter sp.]|uniref:hypothetical protein n=1 Tax=Methanobrevibacter sp. TaxID=66852 RepID=UPI00388D3724
MKKYVLILGLILAIMTLSAVSAETVHVSSDDLVTYFGPETPAGESGYTFAIEVDSGVYYVDYYDETDFADISDNVKTVLDWDLKTNYGNGNDINIRDTLGMKIGSLDIQDEGNGTTMFSFPVGEDFSFTYTDGHTVGFNKNAKVIDEFKN